MPADRRLTVWHQIVFAFLPVVTFWAFYRIGRLRKALAYIWGPSYVFGFLFSILQEFYTTDNIVMMSIPIIGSILIIVWVIYLMKRWTLLWNKQFPIREN